MQSGRAIGFGDRLVKGSIGISIGPVESLSANGMGRSCAEVRHTPVAGGGADENDDLWLRPFLADNPIGGAPFDCAIRLAH